MEPTQDISSPAETEPVKTGRPPLAIAGESLLAAIVESSQDAIIAKDLSGIIRSWNKGAERIFGYTAQEVIGKSITILFLPERIPELEQILSSIRRGQQIDHFETLRRTKDGRILSISLTVSPIRDTTGAIVGASKIARDITSQKQWEQALRVAEERQRLAVIAGNIGLWDWDIAGNRVLWSERMYEFHGIGPDAFGGTLDAFEDLIHPEDRQRVITSLRGAVEKDAPYQLEFRTILRDGQVRWLVTNARILRDEAGRAVRMLGATTDITERKRSELELQRAKRQVEDILRSIRESFIAVDRNWRFTYVNDRVATRLNLPREEIIGQNLWDLNPEARNTEFWPNYRKVMEEQVPLQFDVFYPSLQGWYEVHAYPTDEGLAAYILDITDRRLADKSLKAAESRARLLADAGAVLVSSLDYEETLSAVAKLAVPTFADSCAVDLLAPDGSLRRVAVEHVDPSQARLLAEYHGKYPPGDSHPHQRALRTGKPIYIFDISDVVIDDRARNPEHAQAIRELGVRSFITAPMVAHGRTLGLITFALSKSGRRYSDADVKLAEDLAQRSATAIDNARLHAELRIREARFRELANALPAFVFVGEPDGRITFLNDRWYSFTGLTPDQSLGFAWSAAVHPDDREPVLQVWEAACRSGTEYAVEWRCRSASGRYFWFMARAVPVRDGAGNIVQWFGTSTDIQEAKRNEEELRRANSDLEQFAYSASHDLKEPLRAVAIYSQLLERDYRHKLDARGEEYLQFTMQAARRMEKLVSDLLTYTQAVKVGDEPAPLTSADDVLDQVLESLHDTIAESGVRIEREPLPSLRVEEVHLFLLFQNVIANAIKYRGDDPPVIRIAASPEGPFWRVCVKDNGIGIEPQYRKQIFGLFKRLHSADRYSGSGLGLAICEKIVHRYGGRIWVDSEGPGRGSMFCLAFPSD